MSLVVKLCDGEKMLLIKNDGSKFVSMMKFVILIVNKMYHYS